VKAKGWELTRSDIWLDYRTSVPYPAFFPSSLLSKNSGARVEKNSAWEKSLVKTRRKVPRQLTFSLNRNKIGLQRHPQLLEPFLGPRRRNCLGLFLLDCCCLRDKRVSFYFLIFFPFYFPFSLQNLIPVPSLYHTSKRDKGS